MNKLPFKPETRIIPEDVPAKFFYQHLKPYEFLAQEIMGKKVLEVGSGDGYGSFYLARARGNVTGIDYDKSVVANAQRKYSLLNLKFVAMDATHLEFTDNSFDCICSFQVIEHIPEEKLLLYLSEIKRVLKPKGKFFLSTLNLDHSIKDYSSYKKNEAHCKEFRLDDLRGILLKVFDSVDMRGLHLTTKHLFFLRLKKSGFFRHFPKKINPVTNFYEKITTNDFLISKENLKRAIDFICICQ